MAPLAWLLLVTGCFDYSVRPGELTGVAGPGDIASPGTDTNTAPGDDSATPEPDGCGNSVSPREPAEGASTCTPFDVVSWDLVVESQVSPAGAVGPPIALSLDADGSIQILFHAITDGDEFLESVAGTTLASQGKWDVPGDTDGIAALRTALQDKLGSVVVAAMDQDRRQVTCMNLSTGTIHPTQYVGWGAPYDAADRSISLADPDNDGMVEVLYGDYQLDATCTLEIDSDLPWAVSTVFPTPADLDGDNRAEILGASGIWNPLTSDHVAWSGFPPVPDEFQRAFEGAALRIGDEIVILGTDAWTYFRADTDGSVKWAVPPWDESSTWVEYEGIAIGDATGDGIPEICANVHERLVLLNADGNGVWSTTGSADGMEGSGGCAMADLDADGEYEVIDFGSAGFGIYDGPTGERLAWRDDVVTLHTVMPPIVADVDADGSAEIVVAGTHPDGDRDNEMLFVLGPTEGRWARTRPIWNQLAYDVTSVYDNGTLVRFPRANHATYNSFRAQPAHDGDYPDLVIEVTDACATSCDAGGIIQLHAVVSNLGSTDAAAGAEVVVHTFTEATGLIEVARATIFEPVVSLWSAEGVILDVPIEEWGEHRIIEVVAAHDDECDMVNDRVDVWVDPCGEE